MRAHLIAASTDGYLSLDASDQRTAALRRAIERAPASTQLVIAPAGYWTAHREADVEGVIRAISAELASVLARRILALLAGIDALPVPRVDRLAALAPATDELWLPARSVAV